MKKPKKVRGVKELGKRRGYITPEDVAKSIRSGCPKATVQQDVLDVLGNTAGLGAEDSGLCAFVASNFDTERADAKMPPETDPYRQAMLDLAKEVAEIDSYSGTPKGAWESLVRKTLAKIPQ